MAKTVRLGSLGDRLGDDLRSRIITGELRVGQRIPEELLAEEYDVSRGPVRDALKTLAAEQLIDLGRSGAVVRGVGPHEVDELYGLRRVLEPLAVEEAIAGADPSDDWGDAAEAVDGMAASADARRWIDYADHDLRFHGVLYARSGNSRLQAVWERYRPTFGVMMRITTAQDADLHPSALDHADLLEALRSRDLGRSLDLLLPHLDGSHARMLSAIREQESSTA